MAGVSETSPALQDCLAGLKVDILGIAGSEKWSGTEFGEKVLKLLPSAKSLVVLGMEIYAEALDARSPGKVADSRPLNEILTRHLYYLDLRLNGATHALADASHQAGFRALPLPPGGCPEDSRFLEPILSYNQAAEVSGVGHVGMNGRIVTTQFGPRVRLAVFLTEAELASTAEAEVACRGCNACVSKCPSHALTWPENDEPFAINRFACRVYQDATGGCFECVRQCPVQSPLYK
ncbi:MAG: 4Fe-4S dicluster domain-containing protein [Syntrophorhabdales bacterium]|jgi:epoxyqueuosine reductase QueG